MLTSCGVCTYKGDSCSHRPSSHASRSCQTCWRSSVWPSRPWWHQESACKPQRENSYGWSRCKTSCKTKPEESISLKNLELYHVNICDRLLCLPELSIFCVSIRALPLYVVPLRWPVWSRGLQTLDSHFISCVKAEWQLIILVTGVSTVPPSFVDLNESTVETQPC